MNDTPTTVLLASDAALRSATLRTWLAQRGCQCQLVTSFEEACRELSQREFDLVLCQYNLPDRTAFPLLDWLEGSANAIKHSGSRHFEVSLSGGLNEVELAVRDFGIGFDPQDAMKGNGLGLTSIRERLKLVNGNLSIDSQPQRGTTIQARVPLTTRMKSAAAAVR
jgi:signal transduction histidine kinase